MLGEPVREGSVRFDEDERRILGHGLGVVLDAALVLVLAGPLGGAEAELERELELAVRPLAAREGTLLRVPVLVVPVLAVESEAVVSEEPLAVEVEDVPPLDSSEPEERAESRTAFMSAVKESSDEEDFVRGRSSTGTVIVCESVCVSAICQTYVSGMGLGLMEQSARQPVGAV